MTRPDLDLRSFILICLLLSMTNCGRVTSPGSSPETQDPAVATTGMIAHGVATGDVTSDSALVWVRTDGPAEVEIRWAPASEWAESTSGTAPQRSSPTIERRATKQEQDFTLKAPLEGLRPATRYRYEARPIIAAASPDAAVEPVQGEFTTAPSSDQSVPVILLWGADIGGQRRCRDAQSGYPIFEVMLEQKPDLSLLLGDLIYADDICPSPPNALGNTFTASSLNQYRAKHRYQRGSSAVQRFLASVPVWAVWDDHDVRNNFSGPHEPRMPNGRQAFLEYWPIRTPPNDPTRLYRHLRYGADLELFVLDTRQYRSRNADRDGPAKTMLGQAQLAWLLEGLTKSTATWKVIASSVPLSNAKEGPLTIPGNDSWATGKDGTGFQTELDVIVKAILSRRIHNVVWLTGDVHYAQGNVYDPQGDGTVQFHEFTSGPLSAASRTPLPPEPSFRPTTLFSEGGFMNFGKVTVRRSTLDVAIIDDTGKVRFSHQVTAR